MSNYGRNRILYDTFVEYASHVAYALSLQLFYSSLPDDCDFTLGQTSSPVLQVRHSGFGAL